VRMSVRVRVRVRVCERAIVCGFARQECVRVCAR